MTQERARLLELADRVEAATGPDRELDWDILKTWKPRGNIQWSNDPRYTASLDAAMTLVPVGWRVVKIAESEPDSPPEELAGRPWNAMLKLPSDDLRAKWGSAVAETPALALTAACLRALANQDDSK